MFTKMHIIATANGLGEEYCNGHSTWRPECPTFAPTSKPSEAPTTSQPTFIVDLETQCSGEPCIDNDDTYCRSDLGFCGGGNLYCNTDSVWVPDCITLEQTTSPSKVTSTVTFAYSSSKVPSSAPNSLANWGSFALPTLMTISEEQGNDQIQSSVAWQEQASIDNEELLPTITDEEEGEMARDDDVHTFDFLDRFIYLGEEASGSFLPSIQLAVAVVLGILPML